MATNNPNNYVEIDLIGEGKKSLLLGQTILK